MLCDINREALFVRRERDVLCVYDIVCVFEIVALTVIRSVGVSENERD